jgi:hypothetical protein
MIKTLGSICIFTAIVAVTLPAPGEMLAVGGPNTAAKADRLDIGSRVKSCDWPYYDSACFNDSGTPVGDARKVRVIPVGPVRASGEQPASALPPHHPVKDRERCASLQPSCWSPRRYT